jgi:hypothetical protein
LKPQIFKPQKFNILRTKLSGFDDGQETNSSAYLGLSAKTHIHANRRILSGRPNQHRNMLNI